MVPTMADTVAMTVRSLPYPKVGMAHLSDDVDVQLVVPHSFSAIQPIMAVGVKLTPPKLRPSIVSVAALHVGMFHSRR